MRGKPQSYKDIEIYLLAKELAVKVHRMTLRDLPKFEMYEEGSQIRKSSKSVVSNIVEGYGRKRYKNEFIQFLTYALASCDETKTHLEMLYETSSLNEKVYQELFQEYERLGPKIFNFRETVIKKHNEFYSKSNKKVYLRTKHNNSFVIPVKTGIQFNKEKIWIPASAGMTN